MTLMQQAVPPPGEAMADWQIIARVACAMGYEQGFSYASASEVFEEIRRFANPKTGYDISGASHAACAKHRCNGPAPGAASDRNPIRYLGNGADQPTIIFPTEGGKAFFLPRPHLAAKEMPDADFPLILNTGRLQHQWHTLTKTGKVPTLNKLNPGPFIEVHPEDAQALGIGTDDRVEIRSRRGRAVLPAVVSDRVRPGNCFAPFHWNDVFGDDLAINAVTSDAIDPISMQPDFKFSAVALTRLSGPVVIEEIADDTAARTSSSREPAMSVPASAAPSIADALATFLRLPPAPIELSMTEQHYMGGFTQGLRMQGQSEHAIPFVPDHAPFDRDRRHAINGLLAGLYARMPAPLPVVAQAAAAPVPQRDVLILWASQTGNAQDAAERCAETLSAQAIAARHLPMEEVAPPRWPRHRMCWCWPVPSAMAIRPTMARASGRRWHGKTRPGWIISPSPCWPLAIPAMTSSAASGARWMPGWRLWVRADWSTASIANPIMMAPIWHGSTA
jgi:sulfite reductase (NADPH) flavoprotein alpha-component